MRYEVRKNNGVWHVFDTWEYQPVAAYPANQWHQADQSAGVLEGLTAAKGMGWL